MVFVSVTSLGEESSFCLCILTLVEHVYYYLERERVEIDSD